MIAREPFGRTGHDSSRAIDAAAPFKRRPADSKLTQLVERSQLEPLFP